MDFYKAKRSGTARSKDGGERDRGTIIHLVTKNDYPSWQKAICGILPRGNGWHYEDDKKEVTCEKCLNKFKATMYYTTPTKNESY